RGPEFLALHVAVLVLLVLLAVYLRWSLRQSDPHPGGEEPALGPYETAYLAGGEGQVIRAALASLLQRGAVSLKAGDRTLEYHADLPPDAPGLERVLHAAAAQNEGLPLRDVRGVAAKILDGMGQRLTDAGLLVDAGRATLV